MCGRTWPAVSSDSFVTLSVLVEFLIYKGTADTGNRPFVWSELGPQLAQLAQLDSDSTNVRQDVEELEN